MLKKFLIHRVELKEYQKGYFRGEFIKVSNSPCGVESGMNKKNTKKTILFLIHRVELKVVLSVS